MMEILETREEIVTVGASSCHFDRRTFYFYHTSICPDLFFTTIILQKSLYLNPFCAYTIMTSQWRGKAWTFFQRNSKSTLYIRPGHFLFSCSNPCWIVVFAVAVCENLSKIHSVKNLKKIIERLENFQAMHWMNIFISWLFFHQTSVNCKAI